VESGILILLGLLAALAVGSLVWLGSRLIVSYPWLPTALFVGLFLLGPITSWLRRRAR